MRRREPLSLDGVDRQCAIHQFIRVHGRRPAPEELAAGLRDRYSADSRLSGAAVPKSAAASVGQLVRRRVARVIARL